jgi:chemotaxis protein MotB
MKFSLLSIFLIVFLFSACVPSKKYNELMAVKLQNESDLAERTEQLNSANRDIAELDARVKQLMDDTTSLGEDIRNRSRKLAELEGQYSQLDQHYKNLLGSSGRLNREVAQQSEQLLALRESLEQTRRLNDSLSVNLEEREKKVKELETILANQEKAVQDLRNRIQNALLNFKENDLTVQVKNGKVYVSLAEQLLFASGSIEVDPKGQQALNQLAQAIKDQKDLNILVEGHTDNVPVSRKSQYMQDNWDLSVMRATAITKILTRNGVSPKQVTASGRAEFTPVAANDTAQNKAKNRRTEIIITPNLDELFKILESN